MTGATDIKNYDIQLLAALARKYIWWKTPQEATRQPERIIAQVMDIGDYDDVCNVLLPWWAKRGCAGSLSTRKSGSSPNVPGITGTIVSAWPIPE